MKEFACFCTALADANPDYRCLGCKANEAQREAVAAEREACARLAEAVGTVRWPRDVDAIGPDIAAAIRARGQ